MGTETGKAKQAMPIRELDIAVELLRIAQLILDAGQTVYQALRRYIKLFSYPSYIINCFEAFQPQLVFFASFLEEKARDKIRTYKPQCLVQLVANAPLPITPPGASGVDVLNDYKYSGALTGSADSCSFILGGQSCSLPSEGKFVAIFLECENGYYGIPIIYIEKIELIDDPTPDQSERQEI